MTFTYSLCFVDDDPDEVERFRQTFANVKQNGTMRFFVGAGTSLQSARNDLRAANRGSGLLNRIWRRRVDLYVLDMYFPRGGTNHPDELRRLGKAWDNFREAERQLKAVLSDLGQDFEGGRRLAAEVSSGSRVFGKTPFVFFTRKGNLSDAITAYEEVRALSVIKKPDPRSAFQESERKGAYDEAMLLNRENIIRAFESAIARGSLKYQYKDEVRGFILGVVSSVAVAILIWLATKYGVHL